MEKIFIPAQVGKVNFLKKEEGRKGGVKRGGEPFTTLAAKRHPIQRVSTSQSL